jgi:hypothetical protein
MHNYRRIIINLQKNHGRLSADIDISHGEQIIPIDPATGNVHPFWEEHHTGLHKFVFLVAEDQNILDCAKQLAVSEPIRRTDLKQLAKDLSNLDGDWRMLRVNVLFGGQ